MQAIFLIFLVQNEDILTLRKQSKLVYETVNCWFNIVFIFYDLQNFKSLTMPMDETLKFATTTTTKTHTIT